MNDEIEVLKPEVVAGELDKIEKQTGIAEDSALTLRNQFAGYYNTIAEWREKAAMVTKPEDATHQKIAREVRLGLKKVRCEVENVRKALKADSLSRGKAIDGFANVLTYLCEPIENKLLDVELFAERQEEKRIADLIEVRTKALVSISVDPAAYNLGAMDEKTFDMIIETAKQQKAQREEALRQAEAERITRENEEALEQARIREENKKLKAERQAREKLEQEAEEAIRKEQERKKAERIAQDKAARAPDREKIKAFAAAILDMDIPKATTDAGKEAMIEISQKRDGFACWIEKQAESL